MFQLILAALVAAPVAKFPGMPDPAKLTVVLVVDQFRPDNFSRFQSRLLPKSEKGYRFLLEGGAYYPWADMGLYQNMTCPGHAIILTGSYPYRNGIAQNVWWDSENGKLLYCAEDADYKLVPNLKHRGKFNGTSPRLLKGTTVGDELKSAGLPSKVVAISLKDRGAIMLGGHRADLALWFQDEELQWMTSDYYTKELPGFVQKLNQEILPLKGKMSSWETLGSETGFSQKIPAGNHNSKGLGEARPFQGRNLLTHPKSLELIYDAALASVRGMKLGAKGPDILTVSISTHDYLGHRFSPDSLENEEITVAEDRALSRFLKNLEKTVPLSQVQIVMTSDHGIPHHPQLLSEGRVDAGTFDEKEWKKELEAHLKSKFSQGDQFVADFFSFQISLDEKSILKAKIQRREVESEVKKWLLSRSPVVSVSTRYEVEQGIWPQGIFGTLLQRTYSLSRSAHVVFMVSPHHINREEVVNHLTGYTYDRFVPLVFWGRAFKPGVVKAEAKVVDIAPTLSFLFGVVPPALAEGRVLFEALR